MRSMAGLLSLLVGVCSGGAGGERQEPSKWVVDLQAPLVDAYEETNERGQVLKLGEREISFKLTQPADSVVVEVLFSGYAGSGGETYIVFDLTPEMQWPQEGTLVRCSELGPAVWRRVVKGVSERDTVRMAWDYVWDEELIRGRAVAAWGREAYGGGLTREALPWKLRTVRRSEYPYKLSCRDWLPDPYNPQEIWGTWRHDERGRVVQGGYVIRTIAYAGGENESRVHMQPSLAALATGNGVGWEEVLRGVVLDGKEEYWGWYKTPTSTESNMYWGWISEFKYRGLMNESEVVNRDSLLKVCPWLDRSHKGWTWGDGL